VEEQEDKVEKMVYKVEKKEDKVEKLVYKVEKKVKEERCEDWRR